MLLIAQATAQNRLANDSFMNGLSPDKAIELFERYGLNTAAVLLLLICALILSSWVARMVTMAARRARIEETLARFFGRAARWTVLLIAGLFVLDRFGFNTSSFAVVLGSLGLAIGLAFQGALGNMGAGVMLLIFRPFKVGDYVEVADEEGHVEEIELFTCKLHTVDRKHVIIPNGEVFSSVILNFTASPMRRVDVSVHTACGSDLVHIRSVLHSALQNHAHGIYDQAEYPCEVVLHKLHASSVEWELRLWTQTEHYWPTHESLCEAARKALDDARIPSPTPRMNVQLEQPA